RVFARASEFDVRVGAYAIELLGMRQQRVEHGAQPVEGRVGARREEQPYEGENLFVGQGVTVVIGGGQGRDEIVPRRDAALCHQWAQHVGELGLRFEGSGGIVGI